MSCTMCMQRAAPLSISSARSGKSTVVSSSRVFRPVSQLRTAQRSCRRLTSIRAQEEGTVTVSEEQVPAEEEPLTQEAPVAQQSQSPAIDLSDISAPEPEEGFAAEFALNVLWLDKSIGLAVDQIFKNGQRSPITEFFFWPKADAWEQLNVCVEGKDWISERNRVLLLNNTTDIINFWQDEETETKNTVELAKDKFPGVVFQGA